MKQLTSILMLLLIATCFAQESDQNSSFLTRNKSVELFPTFKSLEPVSTSFKLKLPTEEDFNKPYQSDFRNFMANDSRLWNYPMTDLSQANDVVFGNYMNTSFNLGNSAINTIYIFDQTGRFVNSRTSYSFGKKKR